VIACATVFLLLGQGEVIVVAPILLPALWWAYRWSRPSARVGFGFLAGLVAAEIVWFVAYTVSRESRPLIYLAPALGFAGVNLLFAFSSGPPPPKDVTRAGNDRVR